MAGTAWYRSAGGRSRTAPVAAVLILGRRGRAGGMMPAGGIRRGRVVHAICAGWDPAPVRQSELPPRYRAGSGCRAAGRCGAGSGCGAAGRCGAASGWRAASGCRAARRGTGPVLSAAVSGTRVRRTPVRRCAVRGSSLRCARVRGAGLRDAMGHPRSSRAAVRHRGADDLAGHRPVVGEWACDVGHFAPGDRAQRRSRAGRSALTRRAAAGRRAAGRGCGVRAAAAAGRRIPLGLPRMRRARWPEPLRSGRHIGGSARRMTVVASVGRPCLVLGGKCLVGGIGRHRTLGAIVAPVALMPGRTVRVTAEAAVATFHPVPPAAPQHSCPCPLSVGRQKSPV